MGQKLPQLKEMIIEVFGGRNGNAIKNNIKPLYQFKK